ncbi:MAG: RagB/SusD family nutrient uptake outer membrane protein [Mangrovibacterium sp.]
MKKSIYLFIALAFTLSACNDFLDREPLADISTATYLWSEADLAAYSANLYNNLTSHAPGTYSLGTFAYDNGTDNQIASTPATILVKGQTRVSDTGGDWDFSTIRTINYFINTVNPRIEAGEVSGNTNNINHYLGEMYFFRAWVYFNKLIALGDFPILKEWVSDDYQAVREASKRRPRNEVVRFIVQDLDKAYELMLTTPPSTNRLTKDCAALFKSRVALFEGTWEKYHRGTARVPGGEGWPGKNMDYLKDFSINLDTEIAYFLGEAVKAAEIVANGHTLATNYESMFNSNSLSGNPEVLLWRAYSTNSDIAVFHYVVGYIQRNGGGNSGYTRSMIESFLMKNGLPVYAASSGFQGDATYAQVFANRDPRLGFNVLKTGDLLANDPSFTEWSIDGKGYYYRPPIVIGQNENRCPTGYSVKKGLTPDAAQASTKPSTIASVVFRAAEAYLNYIEAYYELNGNLGGNCDSYWKAVRNRAGMDNDYSKTIANTDLNKELDLARYSGSNLVDKTLYNIRRERRVEFAAEAMRWNDLKRWRALDLMQNYHVQGFNLWDENYKLYSQPEHGLGVIVLTETGTSAASNVSAKSDGKYLMPFRANTGNIAFNGFNWNQNKYLNPIATTHFRLTTAVEGDSDYSTSSIYQNPGWTTEAGSLPEGD